jgi:hypothetical protein
MKKIFTLFLILVMVREGFSQTYASWDFTTLNAFPAGFVTWNLDGQTVNSNLTQYIPALSSTKGWVLDATHDFFNSNIAMTGSYFVNTSASSDRWLITAPINIPSGVPNVGMVWYATSLGPYLYGGYYDNYQVLVSTTDSLPSSFTNLVTINGETGNTHSLALGQYAGQTIRIAIRDTTLNGVGLILPNLKVVNLPQYAATVNDVEIYEHNYLNNPVLISGLTTNTGLDTINTFTLNYSVNGGAAVSAPVTNAGLVPQQQFFYNHPTPFSTSTAGTYAVKVWFSGLNGSAASSDTSSVTIFYYPQVAGLAKNVLVEEMTGAGCPWCSGGALTLRDDYDHHTGYVIPVAIHSADINDLNVSPADALQITDGQTVVSALATGFPTAMIDRQFYFDNQSVATNVQTSSGYNGTYQGTDSTYIWDTLSVFRYNQATPVNVSLSVLSFDSTTSSNNLVATVNATFLNSLSQGTYNLNLYVVEDSVLTPAGNNGNGYNQDNGNYSGQASSGNSELYSLPAVLTDNGQPDEWAQNHVLRLMAGGPWGSVGVIPSAPQAGGTYSKTYTVSVPSTWRYNYIHLVGLVQEYNSDVNKRLVLNSTRVTLVTNPTGIKPTAQFNSLSVYPNPASTTVAVQMDIVNDATVSVSVLNALGQVAIAPTDVLFNSGSHTVNLQVGNLDAGLYFVKVTANGEVNTIPLSIIAK